jgi:hypothetical protein
VDPAVSTTGSIPFAMSRGTSTSNTLTARWIERIGDRSGNFVLSGAAVVPLLAFLAVGAHGRTRDELERALGIAAPDALAVARELLERLDRIGDVLQATGIWIREDVPIEPSWGDRLPRAALSRLTGEPPRDAMAMDAWVSSRTHGILTAMPVRLTVETLMVLGQAIALGTDWADPFEPLPLQPHSGPWTDRVLSGLFASFDDLDRVFVFEGTAQSLTMFRSIGTDAVDVYLVIGERSDPAGVLAEAIRSLDGATRMWRGGSLQLGETGPGFVVVDAGTSEPGPPSVEVVSIRFDIQSRHDLSSDPDVFGLGAATEGGDFAPISQMPLRLDTAMQSVRAMFTPTGFEAAAVTALDMRLSIHTHSRRVLRVAFDRPFGFLAIDRSTGLVIFAGWVAEPEPWQDRRRDRSLRRPRLRFLSGRG